MAESTTLTAPTEEVIPPSDADATTDANAVELEEAAGKEGSEGELEAAAQDAVTEEELPALKEAREAAVRAGREEGERLAREEREQEVAVAQAAQRARLEEQRVTAQYRQEIAAAGQRAYDYEIALGNTEQQAQAARGRDEQAYNSYSALVRQAAMPEATREAKATLASELNEGIYNALGRDKAQLFFGTETDPKGYTSIPEALIALVDAAKTGLMTEAQWHATDAGKVLQGQLKEISAREKAGLIPGASSGAVANGGAATRQITYAQLLKMTDAQVNALPEGMVSEITAKAISEGK